MQALEVANQWEVWRREDEDRWRLISCHSSFIAAFNRVMAEKLRFGVCFKVTQAAYGRDFDRQASMPDVLCIVTPFAVGVLGVLWQSARRRSKKGKIPC